MDLQAVGTDVERVIATQEQLSSRIAEMAAQVDKDYAGKDLLLVGVLKGAVMAMADLTRAMQRHIEMDWMAVSSYGSGTKSSGVVRILKDLDRDITGRNILIVEVKMPSTRRRFDCIGVKQLGISSFSTNFLKHILTILSTKLFPRTWRKSALGCV